MFLTYPQNIPMLCQIIAITGSQHSSAPNKTIVCVLDFISARVQQLDYLEEKARNHVSPVGTGLKSVE